MRFIRECAGMFLVMLCISGQHFPKKQNISYSGYTTYRVSIDSLADAEIVSQLWGQEGFTFRTEIDLLNNVVDIMVAPDLQFSFINFLARNGLKYYIIERDVGLPSSPWSSLINEKKTYFQDVSKYLSYSKIVDFIKKLTDVRNPFNNDILAKLEVIGQSYEGKNIYMIKISSNFLKRKPIILLEGAMHSREWAGPPTLLYLAQQLVMNFTGNSEMLRNVDFFIIPVSNPDGYEFTRNSDRMWRKSRSRTSLGCDGVDINRNFNFHWGAMGTSSDPCSDIYKGPRAFSEVEARNIKNVGFRYKDRLLAFIAVHSYGSYLLYPWGYTTALPLDWKMLDNCAKVAAAAIESFNGTKYTVGSSARVLYEAAGGSDDWFKGELGIPFAYTLELPGTEFEGFNLPEWKLRPVAQETFFGINEMVRCFIYYYKKNKRTSLGVFSYGDIEDML